MMFLSNRTLGEVVKVQVKFKLNAYMSAFMGLIIVQILGIFISLDGTNSMGSGWNNISVNVSLVSNDLIFLFVAIWAFFVGHLMTTKAYLYDDFSFVTTRLSSNLANIIVLFLMSLFAGATSILTNYVGRVILLLFDKVDYMRSPGLLDDPLSSILNFIVVTLLILTIASSGYLVGMLTQKNKLLLLFLPVIVIGLLMADLWPTVLQFLFYENVSMWVFLVKLLIITITCFALAIVSSNRLEVRP